MIPILFSPDAESFRSHGLGDLIDAARCTVDRDSHPHAELQLQYPLIGAHFNEIKMSCIILAKPDAFTDPQPFRVYRSSKPIAGLVTFYARHVAYDGDGVPVLPFTAITAAQAAEEINGRKAVPSPLTVRTDIVSAERAEMNVPVPTSLRDLTTNTDGSLPNTYGGEVVLDGWEIRILQHAGEDRGVRIEYGVDLTDLTMEENLANMYTGILPYYHAEKSDADGNPSYDHVDGAPLMREDVFYSHTRLLPVDMSEYFAALPTKAELAEKGRLWMEDNRVGIPEINLQLSYAQLGQDVRLYDMITVSFPELGIEEQAKVVRTQFDVLNEIYEGVEVGSPRSSLYEDLTDASRLKKGLLPAQRIGAKSITEAKLGGGAVSTRALAGGAVTGIKLADLSVSNLKLKDDAVTVNKIKNGAVTTEKITDGAVTTNKVLANAITYAKMWPGFQVFYSDIVAALAVYAGYLKVTGALECSVLYARGGYICMGGYGSSDIYKPITISDRNTTYTEDISVYVSAWGGSTTSDGAYYEYPIYKKSGGLKGSANEASWTALAKSISDVYAVKEGEAYG